MVGNERRYGYQVMNLVFFSTSTPTGAKRPVPATTRLSARCIPQPLLFYPAPIGGRVGSRSGWVGGTGEGVGWDVVWGVRGCGECDGVGYERDGRGVAL